MARIFTALQSTVGGGFAGVAEGFAEGRRFRLATEKQKSEEDYRKWQEEFVQEQATIAKGFKGREVGLKEKEQARVGELESAKFGLSERAMEEQWRTWGVEFELREREFATTQLHQEAIFAEAIRRNLVTEGFAQQRIANQIDQWADDFDFQKSQFKSAEAHRVAVLNEARRRNLVTESFTAALNIEAKRATEVREGFTGRTLDEQERHQRAMEAFADKKLVYQKETDAKNDEFEERRVKLAEDRNQHDMNMQKVAFASSDVAEKERLALAKRAQALDEDQQEWLEKRSKGLDKLTEKESDAQIEYQGKVGDAATLRAATGQLAAKHAIGQQDRANAAIGQRQAQATETFEASDAANANAPGSVNDDINTPIPQWITVPGTTLLPGGQVPVLPDDAGNLIQVDPTTGQPVLDPSGDPLIIVPFAGIGMPPMSGPAQQMGAQQPGAQQDKPSDTLSRIRAANPAMAESLEKEYRFYKRILTDPTSSALDRDAAGDNIAALTSKVSDYFESDDYVNWIDDQKRTQIGLWQGEEGTVGGEQKGAQGAGRLANLKGDDLDAEYRGWERRKQDRFEFQLTAGAVVQEVQSKFQDIDFSTIKGWSDTKQKEYAAILSETRDGIPATIHDSTGARQWAEEIAMRVDTLLRSEHTERFISDQQRIFDERMTKVDRRLSLRADMARRLAEKGPDYNIEDAIRESPTEGVSLIADARQRKTAEMNVQSIHIVLDKLFKSDKLREQPTDEMVKAVLLLMEGDMQPKFGGGVGVTPLITPSGRVAKIGPDGRPIAEAPTHFLMTDDFGGMLAEFIPKLVRELNPERSGQQFGSQAWGGYGMPRDVTRWQ